MPKKKFIDKNKAVTFQVVHRSQKDPLAVDEDAPQHVLMPLANTKKAKPEETDKRKEAQRNVGIYYEDDYNYMQHIKSSDDHDVELQLVERVRIERASLGPPKTPNQPGGSNMKLPSNVFASEKEEEVGLLNKAAPMGLRLDWDPEVVAAMDDDYDFENPENELEDNFMELANAEREDGESGEEEFETDEGGSWMDDSDNGFSSDEDGSVHSMKGLKLRNGDAKSSRFTEYSMSSSVMRRNDQLTLLDDRFEQMMSGYDDTEIGALDCDEIEGALNIDSEIVMRCAEDFSNNKKAVLSQESFNNISNQQEMEDDDMVGLKVDARTREKWDCESILSTYSNIYNHPKLIPREKSEFRKINISTKTGLPVGVLGRGLTASALATLDGGTGGKRDRDAMSDAISILSTLSVRPKNETPEERTVRKQALKEYRKERRVERKANKMAFKEETKKQTKIAVNQKASLQAVKIL